MSTAIASSILLALESAIHPKAREAGRVVLHEPTFGDLDRKILMDCLDSGFVSSVSPYVDRFEKRLAEITGSPFVVACANGTAALHVCYRLAGVEAGDEILMPALTFIATANAAVYANATPHFVDVEEATLAVDPDRLRVYLREIATVRDGVCVNRLTGRTIRALTVVHVFGHAARVDELQKVCEEFSIRLIEDAAESLGSTYRGRALGTFADVAATSFNGNKIVTTGGGGAIYCRDEKTARHAKHLTTTAKKPHAYFFDHDEVGFNYRMPGLNAALGCSQLESLTANLRRKRALARDYEAAFAKVAGVRFVKEPVGCESNYWLNAIVLDESLKSARNEILEYINGQGLMTRPIWTLMNRLPMYAACPAMDLSVSKELEARVLNLPSSPFLARSES